MKKFLAAGLCALAGCSQSNHSPASTKASALDPHAVAQIEALLAEKDARGPVARKISSALLYAKYGNGLDSKAALATNIVPDESGRVSVDLKGTVNADLIDSVTRLGGQVTSSSIPHGSARVLMSLDQLESVAALPGVRSVRPAMKARSTMHAPPYGSKFAQVSRKDRLALALQAAQQASRPSAALTLGPVASTNVGSVADEADVALGSARARKSFGVDGTGVNVGVISDSDDFKEAAIASGDLPPDTFTIPGQSGRPGTGEGTAMMEIVHDIAPGAKIFFASAFESPEAFADNIRQLRFTYHCDIIIDDVGYFFESPYQDDIVAAAVDDVYDDGAMYFSSAGNDGNFDNGTSGVWDGNFASGGTLATLPSGYTVHDFGGGVIGNRVEVAGDPVYLHWADASSLDNGVASDDYDLFVLDQDMRNVLIASTDIQDGNGSIPFEFIDATIPVGSRIVIAKKAGSASLPVRVQLSGGELGLTTTGSSYGHPTARGAVGVAAIDVAEAAGGEFTGGPTTQAELFSSDGYRFIYFNPDNSVIPGGPVGRLQPSITAPDGVSTTLPGTSGLNPFFGTSAAAPHAGAVAALLKSAQPDKPNWYIQQIMASAATDIMAPGNDRDSGFGVISAFNTLDVAGVPQVVFLEVGTVTLGGGSVIPGGTGSLSVQLINNGGRDAHTVVGTISSTTPGVTIINGTSTYPNVEDDSPGPVNDTPFTFALSPSFPCGGKIAFALSVSFTGNGTSPAHLGFTVQSGKAATTSVATTFTGPRVAIPDGNATGVNIPLTLSGIGLISKINFHILGATCTAAQGSTTVGIDHSWVGDLTFTLTSPSGTVVTLMSRPGGINNSGNNFCKTILDDNATNLIQNIAIAGAPWQGSFKPASPLSAFAGENANGTWILHATDSVTIDTGGVRTFSLDTTGFSCTP